MQYKQRKRFIRRCSISIQHMVQPINQFTEIYQQAFEAIEEPVTIMNKLKYMLYHNRKEIEEFLDTIHKLVQNSHITLTQKYEKTSDFVFSENPLIINRSSRSPPREQVLIKINVCYEYLKPKVIKSIIYCEKLVIDHYIFEILKFLLKFLGVYL